METLNEREKTHGVYANMAHTAQALKALLRRPDLSYAHLEALDLIATKLARIVNGDPSERDHWRDIAGYATLAERECASTVATYTPPEANYKPASLSEILRRADQEGSQ